MFFRYRNLYHIANEHLIAELRARLAEKDLRIEAQDAEIAQLKAKNERMELALMPLSSAAGAAYVQAQRREKLPPKTQTEAPKNWTSLLKDHIKTLEDQKKAESGEKKEAS